MNGVKHAAEGELDLGVRGIDLERRIGRGYERGQGQLGEKG